ncbi:hypothetical protein TBK1r_02780 [Stieleria magnilauensis]|uniref:Uncharacterized protein n=1 Tax=Stieleria magnilauensis TaxID=2527963 RepID=A0ABX5XHA3_9BACT|nr:hypothetical protein TBK1r_02780 [Planctomycetes bacterium TBK1r]
MNSHVCRMSFRPSVRFQAMRDSVIAIRRKLSSVRGGREVRGVVKDAKQICQAIEKLTAYGSICDAENLDDVECLVEDLVSQLAVFIDRILTFQIR